MYEEFEKQFYCRVQHETDFIRHKNKNIIQAEKVWIFINYKKICYF